MNGPDPDPHPGADEATGSRQQRGSGADGLTLLRVVRGEPSDDELAAVVAVLARRLSQPASRSPTVRRSEWGAHARRLRDTHRHGPGAWRASAWPC